MPNGMQCPMCASDTFENLPGNSYQCKRCLAKFRVLVEGCFKDAEQVAQERSII